MAAVRTVLNRSVLNALFAIVLVSAGLFVADLTGRGHGYWYLLGCLSIPGIALWGVWTELH